MPPEGSAECAKRRAGMRMRYSQVEAGDGEGLAESTAQVPQSWPPAGRLAGRVDPRRDGGLRAQCANRDAVSERPSLSARGGKPRRWRQGR